MNKLFFKLSKFDITYEPHKKNLKSQRLRNFIKETTFEVPNMSIQIMMKVFVKQFMCYFSKI